jgi:phosphoglucomutase
MTFEIHHALESLRPGSKWSVTNNSTITWLDTEQTQPTDAEIQAEIARLQADYEAKEYQRQRAAAYPSMAEQLDMLYWDKVNGTNNWAEAIDAVKQEYPKP